MSPISFLNTDDLLYTEYSISHDRLLPTKQTFVFSTIIKFISFSKTSIQLLLGSNIPKPNFDLTRSNSFLKGQILYIPERELSYMIYLVFTDITFF